MKIIDYTKKKHSFHFTKITPIVPRTPLQNQSTPNTLPRKKKKNNKSHHPMSSLSKSLDHFLVYSLRCTKRHFNVPLCPAMSRYHVIFHPDGYPTTQLRGDVKNNLFYLLVKYFFTIDLFFRK